MTAHPPPAVKTVQARVRRYFVDHAMRPADGRMLLAVSGGPDSTALLILLSRLAKAWRLELQVAHFNHGLRGAAIAAREEAYVRNLCHSLGVSLTTGEGDARALAKAERLSLEDAARRQRYAFLARVARAEGIGTVATGHTASDQAETVLLHLVRGSGLAGLAGISPAAAWPFPEQGDLALLRPLLCLSAEDTRACCAAFGIEPLQDESNLSPQFRRNRIRHEILPALRDLNPEVDGALGRLAESVGEDLRFIESKASRLVTENEAGVSISRLELAEAQPSLRRHALRLALSRAGGTPQDFAASHLHAIERLLRAGKTGDRLDLPHGVIAELRREALSLIRATPPAVTLPASPVSLPVPGCVELQGLIAMATPTPPGEGVSIEVDAEAAGGRVFLRRRRPGDRFEPSGLGGSKKLQDFFVDAHVPRPQRDSIPIFESDAGIVWVGGLRIAEWARPHPGRPTVFLSYTPVS